MRIARVSDLLWRAARFLSLLPEHCANSLRFQVFFVREKGFRTPSRIRVGRRDVALHLLDEDGVREDCMDCLFHNVYGLGHQLGEVRTILDVGANVGFFSIAARTHYPQAIIHAYEPNPRVVTLLQANLTGLDIQIFPEALGAERGFVVMDDPSGSNAARAHLSPAGSGIPQSTVETAIERIGGSVDLLKLDCEGAEWELLAQAKALKAVRNLRLEYHLFDGRTYPQLLSLLSRAGFRIVHVGPQYEANGIIWASRVG